MLSRIFNQSNHKKIFLLIAIIFFFYCNIQSLLSHKHGEYYINKSSSDFQMIIDSWYQIGLFPCDSINDNPLSKLSFNESDINTKTINEIADIYQRENPNYRLTCNSISDTSGFFDLKANFLIKNDTLLQNTCTYLTSEIICKEDQDLHIGIWGAGILKIWVNGKLCFTKNYRGYRYSIYQSIRSLHLSEGSNSLTIKLFNNTDKNYFKVALLGKKQADYQFKKKTDFMSALMNPVVFPDTEKLMIKSEVLEYGIEDIIITENFSDKIIYHFKNSQSIPHEGICVKSLAPNKPYQISFKIGKLRFEEAFFHGNIWDSYKDYSKKIESYCQIRHDAENYLNPLILRYKMLAEGYDRNDPVIQRKLVVMVKEIEETLKHLEENEIPLKDIGGYNIRSYTSNIDNQARYYFFTAPDTIIPNKKYKLAVFMKPHLWNKYPFLKSTTMADYVGHLLAQYLSNKYETIILFPSQRLFGKEHLLSPLASSETFNAINDIKKHYKIDSSNIILFGSCAGARHAINLAESYPDMFNGILIQGLAYNNSSQEDPKYNIQNRLDNIRNLYIYSENDILDPHTPYLWAKPILDTLKENNRHFSELISTYSRHFYYLLISERHFDQFSKWGNKQLSTEFSYTSWQHKLNKTEWVSDIQMGDIQAFYKISGKINDEKIVLSGENIKSLTIDLTKIDQHIATIPSEILYNGEKYSVQHKGSKLNLVIDSSEKTNSSFPYGKNKNVEGPIWEVFSNSFAFIKDSIESSCGGLVEKWNDNFFTSVTTQSLNNDSAIMQTSNIILFGNDKTNNILKQIKDLLPLEVHSDSIIFNGKTFHGQNICYQFCYPNPLNPSKYVFIIGSNNLDKFRLYQNTPWNEGIYDYYIWTTKGENTLLLTHGDFDNNWE